MSKQRKQVSIYSIAKTFTPEEIEKNQQISNMRMYLGIYSEIDASTNREIDATKVPSMYKSLSEYEADKQYADDCIYSRKKIPQSLIQKLVAARKELEKQGILEPLS